MISKVILLITGLLAPFYFLLSLVATLSRYDNFLTVLSSHGKTSTAIVCTSTSCTSTTSATANTAIATATNSNNASNAITTNISLSSLVSPSSPCVHTCACAGACGVRRGVCNGARAQGPGL